MRLHHFTSVMHAPSILAAGTIETTESNHSILRSGAAPNVVWLLDTNDPTGFDHGLGGAFKQAVRFTVEVEATRWTDWSWTKNMDPKWRDILITSGGGPDAADHWWVCLKPIETSEWVEVVEGTKVLWPDAR